MLSRAHVCATHACLPVRERFLDRKRRNAEDGGGWKTRTNNRAGTRRCMRHETSDSHAWHASMRRGCASYMDRDSSTLHENSRRPKVQASQCAMGERRLRVCQRQVDRLRLALANTQAGVDINNRVSCANRIIVRPVPSEANGGSTQAPSPSQRLAIATTTHHHHTTTKTEAAAK